MTFTISKTWLGFSCLALIQTASVCAWAQDPAGLPTPPNGYDQRQNGVAEGNVELVNYPTRNHGEEVMRVYTPPGYSEASEYPTLYLLHGIGGDENEWFNGGAPHVILDNLLAAGAIVPMVLVLPNGKTPKSAGNAGFDNFGDVLLNDLIPFMEANYAVSDSQLDRALAGLSMGGGQTVNFGFPNTDVFAWIGAFSPAPNARSANQTITDPDAVRDDLEFIFISNGANEEQPYHPIAQGYTSFLQDQNIPYMYQIEPGAGHDFTAWKRSLYNFAQRIFTDTEQAPTDEETGAGGAEGAGGAAGDPAGAGGASGAGGTPGTGGMMGLPSMEGAGGTGSVDMPGAGGAGPTDAAGGAPGVNAPTAGAGGGASGSPETLGQGGNGGTTSPGGPSASSTTGGSQGTAPGGTDSASTSGSSTQGSATQGSATQGSTTQDPTTPGSSDPTATNTAAGEPPIDGDAPVVSSAANQDDSGCALSSSGSPRETSPWYWALAALGIACGARRAARSARCAG